MQYARMRSAVARVGADIRRLSTAPASKSEISIQRLGESWTSLLDGLALPPEPTRECPVCGRLGMPQATVCGYCWTKLEPVADEREVAACSKNASA